MVFCAAVGCWGESGKFQDISFYRLPRDQTLRAVTEIEERQFAIRKKFQSLSPSF